jgi:hypothetical protein
MVNLIFPKELKDSITYNLEQCCKIESRLIDIEQVHITLQNILSDLKKAKQFREAFLKEEDVSVTNLSLFSHSKKLDHNRCVLIKVQEHILPIPVAPDVYIKDDYAAEYYSINKVENTQMLYYASPDDVIYHMLMSSYVKLKERYKYRVGNRVHLKTFEGMYTITKIDHENATISCKKWQTLGKPAREIKVKDIKCLAGALNNLSSLKK